MATLPIEVFITLDASTLDIQVSACERISPLITRPIEIIPRIRTILPEESHYPLPTIPESTEAAHETKNEPPQRDPPLQYQDICKGEDQHEHYLNDQQPYTHRFKPRVQCSYVLSNGRKFGRLCKRAAFKNGMCVQHEKITSVAQEFPAHLWL